MSVRLFVGNLSYQATEADLKQAFAENGRTVRQVRVALDRETGRPRGFAFVEMGSEAEAQAAINDLKGRIVAGRPISVEIAQERPPGPRPPRPSGPPGAGGGFGGPRGPGGGPGRPGGFGGGYRGRMESAPPEGYSRPSPDGDRRVRRRGTEKPSAKNDRPKSGRPEERERGKSWRYDPDGDY